MKKHEKKRMIALLMMIGMMVCVGCSQKNNDTKNEHPQMNQENTNADANNQWSGETTNLGENNASSEEAASIGENNASLGEAADVGENNVSSEEAANIGENNETLKENKSETSNVEGQEVQKEKEDSVEGLAFPVSLEDGKLSVTSFFQTDGINPDCKNAEGTEIASIVLRNDSDEYLVKAEVWLTLADGRKIAYKVSDLPAGKSAMAFSVDNQSAAANIQCVDVACEAVYRETPAEEQILVNVDGIDIQVTNTSSKKMSKVTLYCHNQLDEEYFGGTSYAYTISNLKSNESVVIQAVDCILGMAEVVLVEIE